MPENDAPKDVLPKPPWGSLKSNTDEKILAQLVDMTEILRKLLSHYAKKR